MNTTAYICTGKEYICLPKLANAHQSYNVSKQSFIYKICLGRAEKIHDNNEMIIGDVVSPSFSAGRTCPVVWHTGLIDKLDFRFVFYEFPCFVQPRIHPTPYLSHIVFHHVVLELSGKSLG